MRSMSSKEKYMIQVYSANSFQEFHYRRWIWRGIPGMILAILNPNKKVTLIDRKTTFIDFLEIVKSELKLKMSS